MNIESCTDQSLVMLGLKYKIPCSFLIIRAAAHYELGKMTAIHPFHTLDRRAESAPVLLLQVTSFVREIVASD